MENQERAYKPLEITFRIATPIVINSSIRFDSLLQYFLVPDSEKIIDDFELPLRKLKVGDFWFWDCSNSIIPEIELNTQETIKKQIYKKGLNRKNLNIGSGKYCSSIIRYEQKQVPFLRFRAYGDFAKINEVCGKINSLGAYRKNGKGVVSSYEISEICFILVVL